MVIIQFGQDLLHYSLAEKYGLCTYTELVTILLNGSHLTIIQVNNLSVPTHKSSFLLLEIFRIDTGSRVLLLFSHFVPDLKILTKLIIN